MAKSLSIESFKVNLFSGKYSNKDLIRLKGNLNHKICEKNQEKLDMINQYIENKLPSAPIGGVEELNIKIICDDDIVNKYCQLRNSAQTRNIEFSLSLKEVKSLLSKKKCHYTGIPFEGNHQLRRTIDRIDNNKGYISGNVVACTYAANQFKEQVFESKVTANFKGNLKVIKKIIAVLETVV